MKTTLLIFALAFNYNLFAQNPPVIEKSAPQSNNTLPSGGSLGSKSGVNPMGNPGTIANSSSSNSAVNSTITPHPNVEPGVFLTSSPEGTVTGTVITNENNSKTQVATTSTSTGGTVTAVVNEPSKGTDSTVAVVAKKTTPIEVKKKIPAAPVKPAPPVVVAKTKVLPSYKPTLGNYVSEETVARINAKYGVDVYDIRAVKMTASRKTAYIVRLLDNGKLRSELYYDQP